jgi:hypothetical protein
MGEFFKENKSQEKVTYRKKETTVGEFSEENKLQQRVTYRKKETTIGEFFENKKSRISKRSTLSYLRPRRFIYRNHH